MLIGGYYFLCIRCIHGNVTSSCALSNVRPVASVTCDFLDAAFVMVWGSVVSLLFHEVFYHIGVSECYSYACVFE
jgi:hypothetical protein